jgi:hypothetical protein
MNNGHCTDINKNKFSVLESEEVLRTGTNQGLIRNYNLSPHINLILYSAAP